MNKLIVLMALSVICGYCFAQKSEPADSLIGLVVDAKGKPSRNAVVAVEGTGENTTVNRKGIFVLVAPQKPGTIQVTSAGGQQYVVSVVGKNFVKIQLDGGNFKVSEAKAEIKKIGYVEKIRSASGDRSISGDELRATGESNIFMALAGKIPGLNLSYDSSGKPLIIIRGGTSLELDNRPVYVLDGSVVSDFDHLNLNHIVRVEVLKDGSIYGSRGANGAIVVATK